MLPQLMGKKFSISTSWFKNEYLPPKMLVADESEHINIVHLNIFYPERSGINGKIH